MKKLYRCEANRKVAGVCAGLGEYFEIDATVIRIASLILLCMGIGGMLYIIFWIAMPTKSKVQNS